MDISKATEEIIIGFNVTIPPLFQLTARDSERSDLTVALTRPPRLIIHL